MKDKKLKIGLVGCGSIGQEVALFIDKELAQKCVLYSLCDKDLEKAQDLAQKLTAPVKITDVATLAKSVDLLIEAASVEAAKSALKEAILYKKDIIVLSIGALVSKRELLTQAYKSGINLYIPSGAICGIDGLGALSLGEIKSITLTTSKPPRGLIGAKYFTERGIDLTKLTHQKTVFEGTVFEAIEHFPQNINVAATLYLAASFSAQLNTLFDKLKVCIIADPKINRNIHHIEIEANEANIKITIENAPSKNNPKTSALAIFSTQHLLKKIFSCVKIGS